jgi:o-succinylbenzoate---CoA ligase
LKGTPDIVSRAALSFGDGIALEEPEGHVSFAELEASVTGRAAHLGQMSGCRVALPAPESVEGVVQLLALHRAGALVVVTSRSLPPAALKTLHQRWKLSNPEGGVPPGRPMGTDSVAGGRADVAGVVVLTSGSGGQPKGVIHREASLEASARGACRHLAFRPGGRWVVTLPMNHVGGLAILYRALTSGGTMVFPRDRRDLAVAVREATHISLVSTQLSRLLKVWASPPPTQLQRLLVGGSAIPTYLADQAARRGWPVVLSYGMTEMGSLVTATDVRQTSSSGRVLGGRALRIGEAGQIEVGGDALFSGYLDGSEAGEWHETGDIGSQNENGELVVRGRMDNMFISGGENIHPESIEAAIEATPGVDAAVVVPVSDSDFGARPVAFVSGGVPYPEIEKAVRAVIPGYMVPVRWRVLPPCPEGAIKWSRALLIQMAAQEGG